MKPSHESEADGSLTQVLRQWVVDDPLPPHFQEGVWQRIGGTRRQEASGLWASLVRRLEVVLPQPRVAYSYVAALLLLGVIAGSWTAQKQNSRLEASLGSRYLQSIDPFQPPSPDR